MIDVYIAVLPDKEICKPLLCAKRQAEIDGISNERVRREKYYVWKLLEYAIKNSLGADASRLNFTKSKNQKWSCDAFEFSLSHSGELLAVAISDRAVGVDVERIRVKNSERMANYILTSGEKAEYSSVCDDTADEWLIQRWCQKEAIFKSKNEDSFIPSKIETANFFSHVEFLEVKNQKYILALAAKEQDNLKINEIVDLYND